MSRHLIFMLAVVVAGCSASNSDTALQEANTAVARGEAWYVTCQGCHGNNGEGLSGMQAPRLAGLSSAYVERQLLNYRSGVRGGPEDRLGVMMNGRARALADDGAVRDVAAYIATLPAIAPNAKGSDTAEAGAQYYATCVACHGSKGEGNAELAAPALAGTDPHYLARQLRNFKTGIRGREGDELGQQMQAAASVLPDDQAIETVAKYAAALR